MDVLRMLLMILVLTAVAQTVVGQEAADVRTDDVPAPADPQAAFQQVLTPDEAVRRALDESDVVRAIRADAEAARAVYRRARATRYPSINTLATYTRLSDNIPEIRFDTDFVPGMDTSFTLAPVVLNRYHSEISVEQPLFTGLELHNQIRSARHQARAEALEAAQQEADLAFQVREAYWRLYQSRTALVATEQALEQVNAHLRNVRNRQDAGAALASDVLTVQTRLAEVRLERVEAENAAELARLDLNRLVGLPLDAEVELDVEPDPFEMQGARPPGGGAAGDLEDALQQALEANATLAAQRARVEALEAGVRAAQGSWFPNVALNGRYVYARPNQYFFTEQDEFKPTWEAGVALRWDLWDGGSKRAEVQESQARLESAEARLADARDQVRLDVTRQFLDARRAQQVVAAADQNVESAEETLRMLRRQYARGAALSSDVLDAEQALRTAQARRARATADVAIARAAILRTLGQTR